VALAIGYSRPLLALGLTVVICIISSAALPSATWVRFTGFCRWIPWALDHKGCKPHRALVIVCLTVAAGITVDATVMPDHLTAGLILLGLTFTSCGLAIWRPGRDRIRQWRDERLEERRLSRQLTAMDAHDDEDFSSKGISRKDWAAFTTELAKVLREMRASEGRES
jgi:hypothetical protein